MIPDPPSSDIDEHSEDDQSFMQIYRNIADDYTEAADMAMSNIGTTAASDDKQECGFTFIQTSRNIDDAMPMQP